jgi:hypothetical protein
MICSYVYFDISGPTPRDPGPATITRTLTWKVWTARSGKATSSGWLGQGGSVRSKQYLAARLKKNLPSAIHNWFLPRRSVWECRWVWRWWEDRGCGGRDCFGYVIVYIYTYIYIYIHSQVCHVLVKEISYHDWEKASVLAIRGRGGRRPPSRDHDPAAS